MPGMKPNSWYFHLVAEAFKTCINEECRHQGSAAAARERKKCGNNLAFPYGPLLAILLVIECRGAGVPQIRGSFGFETATDGRQL